MAKFLKDFGRFFVWFAKGVFVGTVIGMAVAVGGWALFGITSLAPAYVAMLVTAFVWNVLTRRRP